MESEETMRKTIKHPSYTIAEKNVIVQQYLTKEKGAYQLVRELDLADYSVLRRWVLQYRKFGTCIDRRGNHPSQRKSRPKAIKPNEMSHEELVHYVEAVEDIKKSMAYLKKQKKNT